MDALLIPWRGGDPLRERNLRAVLDWYQPLGLEMALGDADAEAPFNRGASRNAASDIAGDWEVALIADADCVADLEVVKAAFTLARETGKLILPHDNFSALTRRGTEELLHRPAFYRQNTNLAWKLCPWPKVDNRLAPSGAIVLTHEAFDRIGRYDPGYTGWGYEDSAFLEDAERSVGYTRMTGYLWHFYHRPDRGTMASRQANRDVLRRHQKEAE